MILSNPALVKFAEQIAPELVLGQVLIRRRERGGVPHPRNQPQPIAAEAREHGVGVASHFRPAATGAAAHSRAPAERGYELRHLADRASAEANLRLVPVAELRRLAQFTAAGAFRPLKSAPNLPSGWRAVVDRDAELETALNHLYPGAVADWLAAQGAAPPITHYRPFTDRQSGMYRVTQMLSNEQAAHVIAACCYKSFCLKRRLWTVANFAPDASSEKSLIPCLEPCAILLEFARRAARLEQERKHPVELTSPDAAVLQAALQTALEHPDVTAREADFEAPGNPRRLQLLLEKLKSLLL